MKKTIEITAHACVTEKRKFQCLLCNEETYSQALFDTEIGVMAHMLYTHLIALDEVTIAGWSQEMANNLKEQIKRNKWNLDEDISFFLASRNVSEARLFREGKAETVLFKVRKIKNEKE